LGKKIFCPHLPFLAHLPIIPLHFDLNSDVRSPILLFLPILKDGMYQFPWHLTQSRKIPHLWLKYPIYMVLRYSVNRRTFAPCYICYFTLVIYLWLLKMNLRENERESNEPEFAFVLPSSSANVSTQVLGGELWYD